MDQFPDFDIYLTNHGSTSLRPLLFLRECHGYYCAQYAVPEARLKLQRRETVPVIMVPAEKPSSLYLFDVSKRETRSKKTEE